MRRLIAITLGALLVLSFSGLAAANSGGHATGGVTGVGGGTDIKINFNARDHHRHGPMGQAKYDNLTTGTWFQGSVTECYAQDGSTAAFVGEITSADGFTVGDHFKFSVQDNGNGGSGDPDQFRVQVGAAGSLDCDAIGPTFPGVRTAGNLTVH